MMAQNYDMIKSPCKKYKELLNSTFNTNNILDFSANVFNATIMNLDNKMTE